MKFYSHQIGLRKPDFEIYKYVIEKANINPSRLTIVAAGVDSSLDKDSASTRELARRVTFQVK